MKWIMGFSVVVACCAAEIVMQHCESWLMVGAAFLGGAAGGAALGYKAMQKAQEQPASKSDSHENSGNSENNEEKNIEHGILLISSEYEADSNSDSDIVKKALMGGSSPLACNFGRSPSRDIVSSAASLSSRSSRSPGSARR